MTKEPLKPADPRSIYPDAIYSMEEYRDWIYESVFDNTIIDGVRVEEQGFEVEGEIKGGDLAAVVVVELVAMGDDKFRLQIKSGIYETQRPAGNKLVKLILESALDAVSDE